MLVRALGATGVALALLASPAAAAPQCDSTGATLVHEVHETTGLAGGPAHAVERTWCGAGLP